MTEAQYALALADCLDNPVAPDGTFVGLSDSAIIVKALRLLATSHGAAETQMPDEPFTELPGAVARLPAPSLPHAATARPEHA